MRKILSIMLGIVLIGQELSSAYAAEIQPPLEPVTDIAKKFRQELLERRKHDPANAHAMIQNQGSIDFDATFKGVEAEVADDDLQAIALHFEKALTLLQYERDFLKSYELAERKRQEFVYCGMPLAVAGYFSGHRLFYAGPVYTGARALAPSTQINELIYGLGARWERSYDVARINNMLANQKEGLDDFVMLIDLASAFLNIGDSTPDAKDYWERDPMHIKVKNLQKKGLVERWVDACAQPWVACFSCFWGREAEKID